MAKYLDKTGLEHFWDTTKTMHVRAFEAVAAMQAATDLAAGSICHTNGFYSAGDGGAAYYTVSASGTANGMDVLALQGGLFATLVIEDMMNPIQFGFEQGVASDDIFSAMLGYSQIRCIDLLGKEYQVTTTLAIGNDNFTLQNGTFDLSSNANSSFITLNSRNNVLIDGINVLGSGYQTVSQSSGATVYVKSSSNVTISNCSFHDIQHLGVVTFEDCTYANASNNHIEDYSYSGIIAQNGGSEIRFERNEIINAMNTSYPNVYPISLSLSNLASAYTPSEYVYCIGNIIKNEVPWWEGIDAHGLSHAVISGNIIEGTRIGIALSDAGSYTPDYVSEDVLIDGNIIVGSSTGTITNGLNVGITVVNASGATVSNNRVSTFGYIASSTSETNPKGMYITNSSDVDVHGNVCSDILGTCIALYGKSISIHDNVFAKVDNSTYDRAINFTYQSEGCYVYNNLFKNYDVIVRMQNSNLASLSRYNRVYGNTSDRTIDNEPNEGFVPQVVGSNISGVKLGKIGDIVMRKTAQTGYPIGWICTVANTDSAAATWVSLGNLS